MLFFFIEYIMPAGNTYYMRSVQISTAPVSGYFLQSDAVGGGTWAAVPSSIFANGTVSAPSITFTSDLTTGIYLTTGPSLINITVSGSRVLSVATGNLSLITGKTMNIGTTGTTSPLNVFGLITGFNGLAITGLSTLAATSTSGLLTASAGLTVPNGQVLNVGTSRTTSPINVFGTATFNGLAVANSDLYITGTASTTGTSAVFVVNTSAYTTAGTTPVYMSYISGTPINTAGGIPTEAYNLFITGPPTGATDNYNIYIDGGRSYLNSGMRYKITTITASSYTIIFTDYCVIFTTPGAKTATLPLVIIPGASFVIINAAPSGNLTLSPNGNSINGATKNLTIAIASNLALIGGTSTDWYIL